MKSTCLVVCLCLGMVACGGGGTTETPATAGGASSTGTGPNQRCGCDFPIPCIQNGLRNTTSSIRTFKINYQPARIGRRDPSADERDGVLRRDGRNR